MLDVDYRFLYGQLQYRTPWSADRHSEGERLQQPPIADPSELNLCLATPLRPQLSSVSGALYRLFKINELMCNQFPTAKFIRDFSMQTPLNDRAGQATLQCGLAASSFYVRSCISMGTERCAQGLVVRTWHKRLSFLAQERWLP